MRKSAGRAVSSRANACGPPVEAATPMARTGAADRGERIAGRGAGGGGVAGRTRAAGESADAMAHRAGRSPSASVRRRSRLEDRVDGTGGERRGRPLAAGRHVRR